jgi:LCP family protein required for cell wall assembly
MSSTSDTRPRRRAVGWVAVGLVAALLMTVAFVAVKLRANITVIDVDDALAEADQPGDQDTSVSDNNSAKSSQEGREIAEVTGQPLNILVMGSDTREGQGEGFGSAEEIEGARSDTTLLVHLSADREDVTVVSIPRDLVVSIPSCTMADGTRSPAAQDRFNAAFLTGGPECTIRTVTGLTGLPIQHFAVVDFTAFERTIDALGGVEVCLTEAVDDPLSGLDLPAGVSRVDGQQGLAFVRARASLGDGSDLARIERQQAFLASLVREVTSRDLLTDPVRLIRSLDAATQSLSMDSGLAWLPRSAGIARSLASIDPADVSFVTYPYLYNDDLLTVRPDPARATLLTEVLASDAPWPPPASAAQVGLAPAQVSVTVVNATGRQDQAALMGAALAEQGFSVVALSTADAQQRSEVRYSTGFEDAAATVAAAVDGAVPVADDTSFGVRLVLGSDVGVDDLRTVRVAAAPTDEPAPSADGSPGQGEWVEPADDLPSGATSTADRATCAS